MSFFRNTVSVLANQAVIAPIGLVTSIVLARLLSVHDRGVYAVAVEFAAIVSVLAQLGWPASSIYQLRQGRVAPPAATVAALGVSFASALIAAVACLLLEGRLRAAFFSDAPRIAFHLAVALIPFQVLGLYLTGIARGIGRFDIHNGYRFALTVLTLLLVSGVLTFQVASAPAALGALLGAHLGVSLGLVVAVVRSTGLTRTVDRKALTSGIRFGVKTHAQDLLLYLHQRLDIFLLAYLLDDPRAVGLYAVAVGITNRTRMIPISVAMTAYPTLAGLDAEGAAGFVARVSRHATLWMVGLVALLAPLSPIFVPLLFGAPYRGAVVPLLWLLPAVACLTVGLVLTRFFMAIDRQEVNVAVQGTATLANIALNFWLIPHHGIVGAAQASLGSYTLQAAILLTIFRRQTHCNLREILVANRSDLSEYGRRIRAGFAGRSGGS